MLAGLPQVLKILDLQCKNGKSIKVEHFDDHNILYLTNLVFLSLIVGRVVLRLHHNEVT